MTLSKNTDFKDANVKEMISEGSPVKSETIQKDLKTIQEGGADLARHIKEDTIHLAKSVTAEGQHKLDDFKSFADRYVKILEKEIVEKPVQSVAIAVGAGVILSLLLRRV